MPVFDLQSSPVSVKSPTSEAPWASKARAHSSAVCPLVETSSTSNTLNPRVAGEA